MNSLSFACNYANDTTPHASGYLLNYVMIQLDHDSNTLLDWFRDNFMTLNEGKYQLLVCGHKHECIFANIGSMQIWEGLVGKYSGGMLPLGDT